MLYLIITGLFLLVLFLPMKHAFGITLSATFLFIVPEGIDITTYMFLTCLLRFVGLRLFNRNQKKLKFSPFFLLFLGLLFFSIFSYLFFQGEAGPQYLRRFLMTTIIIFLFDNLYNSPKDLLLFIKYILAGVLLLSIHIYTQTIFQINPFAQAEYTFKEYRLLPRGLTNQYVNSNNMSVLLVWGFGVVTGFFTLYFSKYVKKINYKEKGRIFIGGVILMINVLIQLGMLGSRSGFFVLLLVGGIVLFKLNFSKLASLTFVIIFSILLTGSFLSTVMLSVAENVSDQNPLSSLVHRLQESSEIESNSNYSRSSLAKNGLLIFFDNPIFGVGIGNEAVYMRKYTGSGKVSHNTYVALLSELGIIGFLFIIALVLIWISRLRDTYTLSLILMIGIYAYVHSIMLMSIPWLLMAFYWKSYNIKELVRE